MAWLRAHPLQELAGFPVIETVDLSAGSNELPPSDALIYRLGASPGGAGGARLVVRPSGTEPKLKAYLEVVRAVGRDADLGAARRIAGEALARLRAGVAATLGP
jgi:phosphomannomutase